MDSSCTAIAFSHGTSIPSPALSTILSILAGLTVAVLTYLLGLYRDKLNIRVAWWQQHIRSLLRSQTLLNQIVSIAADNRYVLQRYREAYDQKTPGPVSVLFDSPKQLPVDLKLVEEIANDDLANRLFRLFDTIRKINDDMETWTRSYSLFRERLIGKNIGEEEFLHRVSEGKVVFDTHFHFLRGFEVEVMECLAITRVLLANDKAISPWQARKKPKSMIVSQAQIETLLPSLYKEMSKVRADSEAKIQKWTELDKKE
ncbi:MAG: hypothetical protein IPH75_15130 [bacterium]|nr:hypothetical protein [bacterium]